MPATTERKRNSAAATDEARSIMASRVFNAPRELVWQAWSHADHLAQWWGPNGFTITTHAFEFRPGGEWRFIMHGPDGTDYRNHMIYREIDEPHRIAYSHVSGPLFEATATFTSEGKKTRVDVKMVFESAELRDRVAKEHGAVEGLHQTLGRLDTLLDALRSEFVISRTFDASRELMWKAWTEEQRLAKWFGPKGVEIFHSKNDLRPGGVYHYGMRHPDGSEKWGRWVYREVAKPQRLVFVASFSDAKGGLTRAPFDMEWPLEWLSTVTFAADGPNRTTVTVRWATINATPSERASFDQMFASMNQGWSGTFDQLDDYLATAARP